METGQFTVEQRYDWNADQHFAAILRFDELADAMDGQVDYVGLPGGEATEAQVVEVKLKLFGWLPIGSWRMEVLERDDNRRCLRSSERGGAVKSWFHTITVTPLEDGGCLHIDHLDIDAGWLTGFYSGMARRMYQKRHAQRLALRSERVH